MIKNSSTYVEKRIGKSENCSICTVLHKIILVHALLHFIFNWHEKMYYFWEAGKKSTFFISMIGDVMIIPLPLSYYPPQHKYYRPLAKYGQNLNVAWSNFFCLLKVKIILFGLKFDIRWVFYTESPISNKNCNFSLLKTPIDSGTPWSTSCLWRGTPLNNPPIEIHANSLMFALIFWPHLTIFWIFWLHECNHMQTNEMKMKIQFKITFMMTM